nr:hypothetical protein B0A51_06668 [Rachicladosporium sp. CCFEE 5018]
MTAADTQSQAVGAAVNPQNVPALDSNDDQALRAPSPCDWKACLKIIHRPASHQTLSLPDGRSLGYATYGAESGPTIFYLHGLSDCRLTGAWHDAGVELGVRIVAVDRPGIGLSDQHVGRTVLDHANDVRLLARHLKAATYSVMGVSGGGIYALGCAHALPAIELESVAIVAGMGPFDLSMSRSNWTTYTFFTISKLLPSIVRWAYSKELEQLKTQSVEDFINTTQTRSNAWYVPYIGPDAKDMALMRDDDFLACVYESLREVCKHGIEDHMIEREVICASDPGFALGDIKATLPLTLWYGNRDASMSPAVGQAMREAIGGSARLIVTDEAHLSLVVGCRKDILASMKAQMLHN